MVNLGDMNLSLVIAAIGSALGTGVAGMAAMIVAVNIPWIGGVISFLITVLGLGILAMAVLEHFSNRAAA